MIVFCLLSVLVTLIPLVSGDCQHYALNEQYFTHANNDDWYWVMNAACQPGVSRNSREDGT